VKLVLQELPLDPVDRIVVHHVVAVVQVEPLQVVRLGSVASLLRFSKVDVFVFLVVTLPANVAAVDAVGGLLLAEAPANPLQHFSRFFAPKQSNIFTSFSRTNSRAECLDVVVSTFVFNHFFPL
jgi:hypothetical protein